MSGNPFFDSSERDKVIAKRDELITLAAVDCFQYVFKREKEGHIIDPSNQEQQNMFTLFVANKVNEIKDLIHGYDKIAEDAPTPESLLLEEIVDRIVHFDSGTHLNDAIIKQREDDGIRLPNASDHLKVGNLLLHPLGRYRDDGLDHRSQYDKLFEFGQELQRSASSQSADGDDNSVGPEAK